MRNMLSALGLRSRALIQRNLMRFGYRLVRLSDEERLNLNGAPTASPSRASPDGALRSDNPRLTELRARYERLRGPMAQRSLWSSPYVSEKLQLASFRGDDPYVWQYLFTPEDQRRKHYLFARYVADRDPRGLLGQLEEDGAFGCHTYDFEGLPKVSRDLLDSINELYFLDKVAGIFDRKGLQVLDIGAGYGRLAHRAVAALPHLGAYYCTDAVPESTFLSEFYLRYRGCEARAVVVALDELDGTLAGARIDLAVNVHSFSEMSRDAIRGWLRLLADLQVPALLVVPNDGERLLSRESSGPPLDFEPLLRQHGYRMTLTEPVVQTADFRKWLGNEDRFFFFERTAA